MTPDEVDALARTVRNWGRWGDDDQLGTLNLIDGAARRRAAACVTTGRAFSLAVPMANGRGIQLSFSGRPDPVRTMLTVNAPHGATPLAWNDDAVAMGLQAATHWDGLAHASWDGRLYNGYPAADVTAEGARRLGIENVTTLLTRGVLLDVARAKGVAALAGGYPITPADLDAATHTDIHPGDAVLVRTGHMRLLHTDDYWFTSPGLTAATAAWFRRRDIAAVATDTGVFEVYPCEDPAAELPVHRLHIVEMGLTQGQNFVLDALADDCYADGVYEFMLDASPLPFVGGCGSPVNPVAVK